MSQLTHWGRIRHQHALLVEFLEWLEQHNAVQLGPQTADCPFTLAEDFKPSNLADRYFQVDRRQLDNERRAVLACFADKKLLPEGTLASMQQQIAADLEAGTHASNG